MENDGTKSVRLIQSPIIHTYSVMAMKIFRKWSAKFQIIRTGTMNLYFTIGLMKLERF